MDFLWLPYLFINLERKRKNNLSPTSHAGLATSGWGNTDECGMGCGIQMCPSPAIAWAAECSSRGAGSAPWELSRCNKQVGQREVGKASPVRGPRELLSQQRHADSTSQEEQGRVQSPSIRRECSAQSRGLSCLGHGVVRGGTWTRAVGQSRGASYPRTGSQTSFHRSFHFVFVKTTPEHALPH